MYILKKKTDGRTKRQTDVEPPDIGANRNISILFTMFKYVYIIFNTFSVGSLRLRPKKNPNS